MKKAERFIWFACFVLYVAAMGALMYPAFSKASAKEPPYAGKGN